MEFSQFQDFFDTIQEACLPGVWSKGVAIARTDSIFADSVSSQGEAEIILRVRTPDHPVSRKVTLWPDDEDWFCDCNDRNDVCAHVAATVIALKSGKISLKPAAQNQTDQIPHSEPPRTTHIQYRLKEQESALTLERWIVSNPNRQELLRESLVSWVGGIRSGRIQAPLPAVTQDDFAVDTVLGQRYFGQSTAIDPDTLARLIPALSRCSPLFLNDQPIQAATQILPLKLELIEEKTEGKNGFRLRPLQDPTIQKKFRNGAILQGSTLRAVQLPSLTADERLVTQAEGRYFGPSELQILFTQLLPSLQKKLSIEIKSQRIPRVVHVAPKIRLEMNQLGKEPVLVVTPRISYDGPETNPGSKTQVAPIILPDPGAEDALVRKLYSELQLRVNQPAKFERDSAIDLVSKIKKSNSWLTSGDGVKAFSLQEPLTGVLKGDETAFEFYFSTGESSAAQAKSGSESQPIDARMVFRAWRENARYVPLLDGGWAPLPLDWLSRYGEKIESLLALKESHSTLPSYLRPQLAQTFEDLGLTPPPSLAEFRERLRSIEKIPEAKMPADLTATLRTYQKQGVSWLSYLRDSQLGAMLADDMGLGKTLQALCAIRGKTLIIAPTSVIPSWESQIRNFRPSLSICVYHGPNRKLDLSKDIILSSYALLRLERESWIQQTWDTIILDETQSIKNPESQTAQAAHLLQGNFKIALSGTPIENRLEDLWSQFNFLNPGLLGSYETFKETYSQTVGYGQKSATQELQRKIRPFILRRLKREVAPELPPKTEKILYCELGSDERDTYSALLAATRQDVLQKLEQGGSVLAALELLLRLRQACCHPALVPGQAQAKPSSAKVDLLLETLENSIQLGHRSLVFSQWTSYLDLIEKELAKRAITWTRLDGSTPNRSQVIQTFQDPSGPSVMLISLKAGGMGLTLTAADHVFIMDPWWNPSVEEQAADRAHRIGQTNPVLVHRLIAQNTIEERILDLQKSKTQLASQVLEGTLGATSLTRDDLLSLLREI